MSAALTLSRSAYIFSRFPLTDPLRLLAHYPFMDEAYHDKDLFTFYYSLPGWAQVEFETLLALADRDEINGGEFAMEIQILMNRAEHTKDRRGLTYLH